jgi:hypothetical protein
VQKHNSANAVDPDIWTVLTLLVATVSMVAQLVGLNTGSPAKGLRDQNTSLSLEKIREELETAIRNAEKLLRFLANAPGEGSHPLGNRFRFGESKVFLKAGDLRRYSELVQQIALNAGNLSAWTLNLIQIDPGFAEQIGTRIMVEVGGVQQRINDLFVNSPANQEVIDECMLLLRTFSQLLGHFERARN